MATYTRHDLIAAYLTARRWANAHEDLTTYYGARYRGLAGAFGVNLESAPRTQEARSLFRLFEKALNKHASLNSPFSDYLEVPPLIIEMSKRHAAPIGEGLAAVRQSYLDLLVDIVECLWSLPASRTVSDDDLRRAGFDPDRPAPDPIDYW